MQAAIRGLIFGEKKEMNVQDIHTTQQLKKALVECQYANVCATISDVQDAVALFKDLHLKVDIFVANDGADQKLVCLHGTIPVNYKGTCYNIPILIWLSVRHPRLPPLVQVRPTKDMVVKVGPSVDQAGMIKLPYLDSWDMASSDLSSLIQILCAEFAATTPVYTMPKEKAEPDIAVQRSSSVSKNEKISADEFGLPSETDGPSKNDEAESKQEALLTSTEELIRKSQILIEQAEAMLNVLQISKNHLLKSPSTHPGFDSLESDTIHARDWYEKLGSNLKRLELKTEDLIKDVEGWKNPERRKVNRSEGYSTPHEFWTVDEVCTWLKVLKMAHIVPSIRENMIKGSHLSRLTDQDLLTLGVTKLGERLTLRDEIEKLSIVAYPAQSLNVMW